MKSRKSFIKHIEHLKEFKHIDVDRQEQKRLIFNNDEVFELFGVENENILNPGNDYTYEWLHSLFCHLVDHLNENDSNDLESFQEIMPEYIDSEVNVYTSDLTGWLNHNKGNVSYLDDAIEEGATTNILMVAQYKAIEELFNNALRVVQDIAQDYNINEVL